MPKRTPRQGRHWIVQPSSVSEANMRITLLQMFLVLCIAAAAFIREGHAWAAFPAAALWLLLATSCMRLVMFAFSRPSYRIAQADTQGLHLPLSTFQWGGFWPALRLDAPIAWSELAHVSVGEIERFNEYGGRFSLYQLHIHWRDGRKKTLPADLFDERVCADIAATANAAIAGQLPASGADARLRIKALGWFTLLASIACGIALSLLTAVNMLGLPPPWHLSADQAKDLTDWFFAAFLFLLVPAVMPGKQAELVVQDG